MVKDAFHLLRSHHPRMKRQRPGANSRAEKFRHYPTEQQVIERLEKGLRRYLPADK